MIYYTFWIGEFNESINLRGRFVYSSIDAILSDIYFTFKERSYPFKDINIYFIDVDQIEIEDNVVTYISSYKVIKKINYLDINLIGLSTISILLLNI